MDDPWGSPWAATDSSHKDHRAASPAKSDLAPPPRAFLSASNSPRIPVISEQSAWGGDDDGFGEWTAAPDASSPPSVWAGGWGSSSPNLASTPRDDVVLGRTSPIAWPRTIATPGAATASALRQPSPDPWASEGSAPRLSNDETSSTPRVAVDTTSPGDAHIAAFESDGFRFELEPAWDTVSAGDAGEVKIISAEPSPAWDNLEDAGGSDEQSRPRSAPSNDMRASVESSAQSRDCQSPTLSNDNTDHEDERQDSPITPIEDEESSHPKLRHKVSGEIQELVDKFDGLARTTRPDSAAAPTQRSESPSSLEEQDGLDDAASFGDFEDVNQDEASSSPPGTPAASRGPEEEEAAMVDPVPATSPSPPESRPITKSPIAKFGPVNFNVDLGLIDKLFGAKSPENTGFDIDTNPDIPDHIIRDSFAGISERKVWYRISRLGSLRRHNAGDDENYRHITWRSSTVHDETIKIVRRWMEEDSIAGRVSLGGGISKTQKNMFGWDSAAEPVALEAVFGRKKSHSRASSLQTPTTGLPSQGSDSPLKKSTRVSSTHRASESAGPIVASFGWSSTSPGSARRPGSSAVTAERPDSPVTPLQARFSLSQSPGAQEPSTAGSKQQPIALGSVVPSAPGTPGNIKGAHDDADDDDDEWGEMVSSPGTKANDVTGGAGHFNATLGGDPGGSPGVSGFDSASAKPPVQVPVPSDAPGPAEASAKGASPTPASGAPAVLSTRMTAALPGPSEPTTDLALASCAPMGSSQTASTRFAAPQDDHEDTAQRIIANLPDLSYMLR